MENTFDKFAQTLNEILDGKIANLENQLERQQFLIGGLAKALADIQERVNLKKNLSRRPSGRILPGKTGNNIGKKVLKKDGGEAKRIIVEALSISSNPLDQSVGKISANGEMANINEKLLDDKAETIADRSSTGDNSPKRSES